MWREKVTDSKKILFRDRQQRAVQVPGRIFLLGLQGIFCRVCCSVEKSSSPKHREPPAVHFPGAVVVQMLCQKKKVLFSFSFITIILYGGCIDCMQLFHKTVLWIDAFLVLTSAHKRWVFIFTVSASHFSDYVRRLQNLCALHLQPLRATSQSQSNIKELQCLGEEEAQDFARVQPLSDFHAINYLWL